MEPERKKRITVRQLAALAGCSPASVSMILNNKSIDRFSQETVAKVLKLAQEQGYKPKEHSLALIEPARKLIIIVCPSLFNPFYTTIIQGIEIAARREGYTTSVRTTYWDQNTESSIMEQARSLHVAGVIFAMIPQQPQLAYALSQWVPVVAIGDRYGSLELATVDMNNFNAGKQVGQHLLELGHRHIAYLSTTLNEQHTSRVRRCQGLQEACSQYGAALTVLTKEITADYELSHVDVEYITGYSLAQQALEKHPQLTALVAINDMVAYGVYQAVLDAGKGIPQDISLAGFDNIFPSRLEGIGLTSVDNSLTECGKSAFALLQQEIASHSNTAGYQPITHVEYKCCLKVRRTTGPAPKS